MTEHQIFGPPGCGKTVYASRQIRRAAEAYGADRVMACSFTKAAAVELATKEVDGAKIPIPKAMIGTLHSLCYRALDAPALAEAQTGDFSEKHPEYRLSGLSKPDLDDLGAGAEGGDATSSDGLLSQYQLLRARCVGREVWPLTVLGFAQSWERWKDSCGAMDFTDLIEYAPDRPPGEPRVLFVDEAQDMSALQFRLVRKWAAAIDRAVLLADDDQTIFSFTGADPASLLDADIPPENRIVLKQSYRLPRAVHRYATAWIEQVSRRQAKEFLPRDAEGEVRASEASLRAPGREIEEIQAAVERGQSVMVLASCGYMLRGWIQALREAGIPYGNPYRPARGDWNPLSRREGGTAQRVGSFAASEGGRPSWTLWNLAQWTALVQVEGVLKRGAKAEIERLAEDRPGYRPSAAEISERWLTPEAASATVLATANWPTPAAMDWLAEHTVKPRQAPVNYAASIVRKAIAEARDARVALTTAPLVTVGTCHSTKGAEADVVYLAPDLSPQAAEQWHRGALGRDEVRRVLYVGMTRARERLVLLRPMGRLAVQLV